MDLSVNAMTLKKFDFKQQQFEVEDTPPEKDIPEAGSKAPLEKPKRATLDDVIKAGEDESGIHDSSDVLDDDKAQNIAEQAKNDVKAEIEAMDNLTTEQKEALSNKINTMIDNFTNACKTQYTSVSEFQDALKKAVAEALEKMLQDIQNTIQQQQPPTFEQAVKNAKSHITADLSGLTEEQRTALSNRIDSALNQATIQHANKMTEADDGSENRSWSFERELDALVRDVIQQFWDEIAAEKEAEAQKDYLDDAKIAQIRGEVADVAYKAVDEMSLSMDAREELLFALQELFESDPITTSATQFRIDLENTVNELLHEYGNAEGIPSTANTVEDETDTKFDEKQASTIENKLRAQAQAQVDEMNLSYIERAKLLNRIDACIQRARNNEFEGATSAEQYEQTVQQYINDTIEDYYHPSTAVVHEGMDSNILYDGSAEDATNEYLTNLSKTMFESGLSKTEQQALLDQITPLIEQFIEDNPGSMIDADKLDALTTQLDKIVNTYINEVNADKLTPEKQETIKQEVRENALTQLYKFNLPSYVIEDAMVEIDNIVEYFNIGDITSVIEYKNALQEEVNSYLATYEDERAI